jgi:hypothetical protein
MLARGPAILDQVCPTYHSIEPTISLRGDANEKPKSQRVHKILGTVIFHGSLAFGDDASQG